MLAAVAAGLAAALSMTGSLAAIDRAIGDALLRLTHRSVVDAPVAAIVIDDAAVDAYGPLPWPRSRIAELVTAAQTAGAAVVGLDLLLHEPADTGDDRDLTDALDGGPTLLGAALGPDRRWLLPHALFGGAALAAHIHAEVGPDGVVRTIAQTKQSGTLSLPALSLAAAAVLRPDILVEPGAALRPDFRPSPEQVHRIPAARVLSPSSAPPDIAGRAVFIGVTATGAGDRLMVPTHPGPAPAAGVLVHASATASIIRGGLLHRLGTGWTVLALLAAALAPQLLRNLAGALNLWGLAGIAAVVLASAAAVLQTTHLQLPVAPMLAGVIISAGLREAVESERTRQESARLLGALLRHHDPSRDPAVPKSPTARLAALRELQTAVLAEDAARRTLLEGMRDGVVMWDSGGRTVVANGAAERLWGFQPDHEALELFDTGSESESPVVQRGGRQIEVSLLPLADGGMALLRDVTAERELERRRRDMQRMVSHELKTPLASIAGFGESLERYELNREEQRKVATLIRGEAVRLGEMVATFLDLERLAADGGREVLEPVDLAALVRERLEILTERAHARGQRIDARLADGVSVDGAEVLLARVVDNLVGNAVKYSGEGDVIVVTVDRNDADAILTVTDHGPGIPAEAVPRVFDRFYRVPGAGASGSGLGLAVADEVAAWHGGCISLDSEIGRGTTFTVRLPAKG